MKRFLLFALILTLFGCFKNEKSNQNVEEKIWLHRVNSLERLIKMPDWYEGIELDVVYDPNKKCFDVTHPPKESIGLCLMEFLDKLNVYSEKHHFNIWLDFKNLNEENVNQSSSLLKSLIDKYSFLNYEAIIVESGNPKFLKAFKNIGFRTSYYIPTLFTKGESERKNLFIIIEKNNTADYISSYYQDYAFLKPNFPNQKMIFWAQEEPIGSFKKDSTQIQILQDSFVDVLLVRDNIPGWR